MGIPGRVIANVSRGMDMQSGQSPPLYSVKRGERRQGLKFGNALRNFLF